MRDGAQEGAALPQMAGTVGARSEDTVALVEIDTPYVAGLTTCVDKLALLEADREARSAPGGRGPHKSRRLLRRRLTSTRTCCYTSRVSSASFPSASPLPRPCTGRGASACPASFTPCCSC